jgi:superfamily II DNA or RNA helicase
MTFALRDYQRDAFRCVTRELTERGVRRTLVVMPTGTGKTILFAAIAQAWGDAGRGRVLVLSHREELVAQAQDKIRASTGLDCGVEMGDESVAGSLLNAPVVSASVQTLSRPSRLARFPRDAFGLIVVDEAHHATADGYRAVMDHFDGARVLGVTATPDRLDGIGMGRVFPSVAFTYEIRDAIRDGHLVPIRQKAILVESLELDRVRSRAGDLVESDLARAFAAEKVLHEIAAPLAEEAGQRPTIVFTVDVATAHSLARVLGGYTSSGAIALDGSTDRDVRRATVARFLAGDVQYLVNCALFTEGFDAPLTSCVAIARPTQSRALYSQMIGRGTRLAPAKDDLLVLDFRGNAGKHKLVTPADVLADRMGAEERALTERLAASGDLDLLEAHDMALAQIDAKRRAELVALARYKARNVSAFDLVAADIPAGRWGGAPASAELREKLYRHFDRAVVDRLDHGQARELWQRVGIRARDGLATPKRAAILARHGLNPDCSNVVASRAIDAIAANNWRAPEALYSWPELMLPATKEATT